MRSGKKSETLIPRPARAEIHSLEVWDSRQVTIRLNPSNAYMMAGLCQRPQNKHCGLETLCIQRGMRYGFTNRVAEVRTSSSQLAHFSLGAVRTSSYHRDSCTSYYSGRRTIDYERSFGCQTILIMGSPSLCPIYIQVLYR
jgi:hypothetical protein